MAVPRNYRAPRFLDDLRAMLTEEGLVSFECKVVGYPTPILQWFKDGQELKPGDVYQLSGTNSLGQDSYHSCTKLQMYKHMKNWFNESEDTIEIKSSSYNKKIKVFGFVYKDTYKTLLNDCPANTTYFSHQANTRASPRTAWVRPSQWRNSPLKILSPT